MGIFVPDYVKVALGRLRADGHEAYLVGGCVRDSLLGITPFDYDITTSALPSETTVTFEDYRVIETGIEHGTVTTIIDGHPIEITTYRADGEYTDHRRPDNVSFSRSLTEDLRRRDFTVNAIAADENEVIDLFGGKEDIKAGLIRAVGDARVRFEEDALRILRALRFASKLGFEIEEETERAALEKYHLLSHVSAERIFSELCGILMGDNVLDVLMKYSEVICFIIPELSAALGCEQLTPYHIYDVWEHTAHVVAEAEKNIHVRLAALLHDVAKPALRTVDERGRGHFKGHAEAGAVIAEKILQRLRAPSKTVKTVSRVIALHDKRPAANERALRRYLHECADADIGVLMALRRADLAAKNPDRITDSDELEQSQRIIDKLISEGAATKISDLAVDGNDISALGACGRQIGETLSHLLELVIDGTAENEKACLLQVANVYINENFGDFPEKFG